MGWQLIAFDLYGTLLDVNALEAPKELVPKWRARQLERTWTQPYEPFDILTEHALQDVAPELSAAERKRYCDAWLSLPAHPDAAEALRRLRTARAVLSNGTRAMIQAAVRNAGLEIDAIH